MDAQQTYISEKIRNASNIVINPATEETLQATTNKLPTYDMYISYNIDGNVNTKVWKLEWTGTVVKTLTYNYSGGNLVSKILS